METRRIINTIMQNGYMKHMSRIAHVRHLLQDNGGPVSWEILHIQSGYVFLYDKNDAHGFIICVSQRKPKGICFNIDFNIEEGIYINISHYRSCSDNKDLPEEGGTLIMLKAILTIILSKPTINNYKNIFLTDNSTIQCKKNDKNHSIQLMDMYFLCTGCTWYSSLAPMFIRNKIDEAQFLKDRKKIIGPMGLSWDNFLQRLPLEVLEELNGIGYIGKIIRDKAINSNENSSASRILNELRIYTENTIENGIEHPYCYLFYRYKYDFLNAFNVSSLVGMDWGILIKNGRIILCNEHEIHNTCMNKRGWLIPKFLIQNVTLDVYVDLLNEVQR